jgi:hypothetical protein
MALCVDSDSDSAEPIAPGNSIFLAAARETLRLGRTCWAVPEADESGRLRWRLAVDLPRHRERFAAIQGDLERGLRDYSVEIRWLLAQGEDHDPPVTARCVARPAAAAASTGRQTTGLGARGSQEAQTPPPLDLDDAGLAREAETLANQGQDHPDTPARLDRLCASTQARLRKVDPKTAAFVRGFWLEVARRDLLPGEAVRFVIRARLASADRRAVDFCDVVGARLREIRSSRRGKRKPTAKPVGKPRETEHRPTATPVPSPARSRPEVVPTPTRSQTLKRPPNPATAPYFAPGHPTRASPSGGLRVAADVARTILGRLARVPAVDGPVSPAC